MKKIFFLFCLLISIQSNAQLVINEIDSDNPSTDTKEFIEIKSSTPNFALDGYVLVLFNGFSTGLGNASYYTVDLDGYTTDLNGIFLIGNALVSPTPSIIIPNSTIQNGPDAVGVYIGNPEDFPLNSLATTTNLIAAMAYSSGASSVPSELMSALGLSDFGNEGLNGNVVNESVQRKNDGTYETKLPTPGVNNDGSGIAINYVSVATSATTINEGQSLIITFTTTTPVATSPLVVNFTLNNFTFNSSDFTGNLSVTIPVGSSTASTTITVLNDGINDGDEEMKVVASNLPSPYWLNNNNIIVRVIDLNFTTLPFGTPATPTFGNVVNTKPAGYYDSLNGLSGTALKQAIQDIIANPSVVRAHSYSDVYDILLIADQNPSNTNQVWLIYTEEARTKLDQQIGNSIVGKWNREHIYCQSRGGYSAGFNYLDLPPTGINNGLVTDANDIGAGVSDAHHIRAVDGQENSSRNNKNYGTEYNGPTGSTSNAWKGDVARACFYMAVRYNGLSVVSGNPADGTIGQIADLPTLLAWNQLDTSDDFEMNRNNYIYTWQKNRNPFIDMPNLVNYVFGTNYGQVWTNTLANATFDKSSVSIAPNPSKNQFTVFGINSDAKIEIYTILGEKVFEEAFFGEKQINFNLNSGIYLARITSENQTFTNKIIVE